MKTRIARKIKNYANRWRRAYNNYGVDHPRAVRLEHAILNLHRIYGPAQSN